jgi:hypothetical protein
MRGANGRALPYPLGAHRRAVSRLFALVDPERAVGAQPRRVRERPSA